MEPIRLILVRHGNTFEDGAPVTWVGAATDMALTAKGREQAETIGRMFAQQLVNPKAIFFGPLKRQKESAQIIASQLHVDERLQESPMLTEVDYGAWEGRTNDEIEAQWPGAQERWQRNLEWQEGIFGGSKQELRDRLAGFIAQLREQFSAGDTVVAVTSNGIMRMFLLEVAGMASDADFSTYKVKTGNYSVVHVFPDRLEIESWNQTPTPA